MTNKWNTIIYIGVTNNLIRRVGEHKSRLTKGFCSKYGLTKLVYYEQSESIITAIDREKQLKNWRRKWKQELITSINPAWDDLSENIF